MDDLISREALYLEMVNLEALAEKRALDTPTNSPVYMRYVTQMNERRNFKFRIADAPAVDAAPVVHARWKLRGGRFRCTNCGVKALLRDIGGTGGFSHEYEQVRSAVCPSCGARMGLSEGEARDDGK